ncbi:MAG: C2 family cysteine protease [Candidatus Gastranaerophilales bacterium]|nr:C2 family cysteine protease [Candidatus Gastranaerophilales bacterium]
MSTINTSYDQFLNKDYMPQIKKNLAKISEIENIFVNNANCTVDDPILEERLKEYAKINNFYSLDRKIQDFHQGKTGDCWILSSIEALSQSETGREIIKNSLSKDSEGNYLVTFKGIEGNNTFKVTKEDYLDSQNDLLSTGDPDVKVLEIAARKLLENQGIDESDSNKERRASQDEKLKGGYAGDFLKAFTGVDIIEENKSSSGRISKFFNDITGNFFKKRNMEKFLDKAADSGEFSLSAGTNEFSGDSQGNGIISNHAYAIKSVNKEYQVVTLINPWDTSTPITISYDEFMEKFCNLEGFIS